ncbi:hypothetical protein BJX62DRAFT_220757 [Aspergillus germanicus]
MHINSHNHHVLSISISSSTPMSPPLSQQSSILIIGGGTWGCSTALHLARWGYKNVKVLDPYEIPSPIAGTM